MSNLRFGKKQNTITVSGGYGMIFYSIDDCKWCDLLKKRLDFSKMEYVEVKDFELVKSMGFTTVPRLQIPTGEILDFEQAIAWLNKQNSGVN